MGKNPLAHLKHRNPEAWEAMSVGERWFYDEGWWDATALLVRRSLDGTLMADGDEQAVIRDE